MLELKNIDLACDPAAQQYVKTETVTVVFARQAGELASLEGPNSYQTSDALITGATGSRWSVARARFDARYQAVAPTTPGQDGHYSARPIPVLAKRISEPFRAARRSGGDLLRGAAGDWLLQYGPGDHGVAADQRFTRIYTRVA